MTVNVPLPLAGDTVAIPLHEFAAPPAAVLTVKVGLKPVSDAANDCAGEIFVQDYNLNAILDFGPTQSGDLAPIRMLTENNPSARILEEPAIGPGSATATTNAIRRRK